MSGQLPLPTYPFLITPDITLGTITKNGISTSWLETVGLNGNVVSSAGSNNLIYTTVSGSGDVSAASNFTTNNSVILADTASGSKNIKQSSVLIDSSANVSAVNSLSTNGATIKNNGSLLLNDTSDAHSLTLKTASTMGANYTIKFPANLPTSYQEMRTTIADSSQLEWITSYSSLTPDVSRIIYVANTGNDTSGVGSQDNPYLTLAKAITIANGLSTATNPITIIIYPGIYTEANTSALNITALGITISGTSSSSSIIKPSVGSQPLISSGVAFQINNITLLCSITSTSSAIYLYGTANNSVIQSVIIRGFSVGCNLLGSGGIYLLRLCIFRDNLTAISAVDNRLVLMDCNIQGITSAASGNIGINLSGSSNKTIILSSSFSNCEYSLKLDTLAICGCTGSSFTANTYDIYCASGSKLYLSGVQIGQSLSSSDISITCRDTNSLVETSGCHFDGKNATSGAVEGTCFLVSLAGNLNIGTSEISCFTYGGLVGATGDTSSTIFNSYGSYFITNTTDIVQVAASTLKLNNTQATLSKLTINDFTNVYMTLIDLSTGILNIGSGNVSNTPLLQAYQGLATNPKFNYYSSIYSAQMLAGFSPLESAIGNISDVSSWLNSITRSTSYTSGINLLSDTGGTVGVGNVRGWRIIKETGDSDLNFKFQNSDLNGLPAISIYTLLNLDGVNNQITTPDAATQLIIYDTNFYRSASNVLKTDGTFAAGALTADTVIYANSSKQLTSSATTATELSYLSGVTSAIQSQLTGKLSTGGGTLTGALTLAAGSTNSPSLIFTGSATTGLSAASNALSLSTAGIERINIAGTGAVKINGLNTAGVVHTDSQGTLSTSLIVNADITAATIANSALATVSSGLNNGYIVARDSSGNFAANMITLSGTVTNSTDAATKAYVDLVASLGISVHDPAVVYSGTNITTTGTQTIDGVALIVGDRVLLNGQTSSINNGLWVVSAGAWTRPVDFANGSVVGAAYVLISSGSVYIGSAWLCSTTLSVIGTNAISFGQFSLPNQTSGANLGSGTGLIYKNYSGSTLNFRSLLADTYVSITTNTNDITISTNATSSNTYSAIVARDSSGNFTASTITADLTGAASLNLLKTGGTLTGALTLNVGVYPAVLINQTSSSTFGGMRFINTSTRSFQVGINSANAIAPNCFAIFDEFTNKYNMTAYNDIINITSIYPINTTTGEAQNNSWTIGGPSNYFANLYSTEINGTLQTASQPNIATLAGVTSLNNITVGSGTLSGLSSISATSITGTLATVSQPNITTLGGVTSLNNITVGSGTLSGLSSISATSITGTLATVSQPNITTLSGVTSLNSIVIGSGTMSGLSSISATSITGTLATAAQTNITSVGTLSSLAISGNIIPSVNNGSSIGNASFNLNNLYATNIYGTLQTASQPNITTLGGVTSLNNITVGSGTLSGLSSISATSITGTLATVSQPNITTLGGVTSLNNITVGSGTLSGLSSISATSITGTLATAAQTNITSTGTLSSLTVSGLNTSGNLIIGSSGTRQKKCLKAIITIGTSATDIKSVTITFDSAFASAPHIVGTILTEIGQIYDDVFSCTFREITTTGCKVSVGRLFASNWGQNIRLAYTATDIT
jgi:hypothetical protein